MSFVSRFKDATIGFSGYSRLLRGGGAFGYIALLLLFVLTISATISTVQARREFANVAADLASGPDFALENGQVRFNGPMPYRMGDKNGMVIIDTTGKTTVEDLKHVGANTILITRDKLYQVRQIGRVETQDLSMIPITLTKADVVRLLQNLYLFVPIGYVLLYPLQLGSKALDAVFLALLAMMVGSARKRPVSFDLGFKAGLYAMTLSTIIQWIYPGFSTLTLWGFLVWWGLAGAYLIMGLQAFWDGAGPEAI